MKKDPELERLREDFIARQRGYVWDENQRHAHVFSDSVWSERSKIRPSPRIWAFFFLLLGVGVFAMIVPDDFDDAIHGGAWVALLVALVPWFLSYKLFRQARRAASRHGERRVPGER
jgi:hypothetical protein